MLIICIFWEPEILIIYMFWEPEILKYMHVLDPVV